MPNKEGTTAQNIQGIIIAGLFGGILAFAVCGVLLLISALLISKGSVPASVMAALCIGSCAIGAFAGGRFATGRSQSFPALCALCAGIVFCLLVLLAGLSMHGGVTLSGNGIWSMAAAVAASGAAGLLGGTKPKKKTKKRK